MELKLSCIDAMAPGGTLKEKFENLEMYGFSGIEFWMMTMTSKEFREREKEINEIASASKVKPSSIMVISPVLTRPLNSQRAKRQKAKVIKEGLRVAANLGAISFFAFSTAPQICPPLFPLPTPTEMEKELLIELLKDVGRYAEDVGAILAIEPLNRFEGQFFHTLDEAIVVCNEAGSDNIKIMADFFEMNIEERDIAESVRRAGEYIRHVHLSDSNRLLPGYGHIDFKSAFAALKEIGYQEYMTLEGAVLGKPEEELPKCVEYLEQCMP